MGPGQEIDALIPASAATGAPEFMRLWAHHELPHRPGYVLGVFPRRAVPLPSKRSVFLTVLYLDGLCFASVGAFYD